MDNTIKRLYRLEIPKLPQFDNIQLVEQGLLVLVKGYRSEETGLAMHVMF